MMFMMPGLHSTLKSYARMVSCQPIIIELRFFWEWRNVSARWSVNKVDGRPQRERRRLPTVPFVSLNSDVPDLEDITP